MLLSPIGLPVDTLDTPALLLDLDAFEHNVALMAKTHRERGIAWRPHAKAFKSPAIAHILIKAGAIGMTVAKVSEAEVMAAGGIEDILIAHIVVGPSKAARLAALQRRAEVKTTVDHPDHLAPLGAAARQAGTVIGVLVDVDLGLRRAGVDSPEAAVALARRIAETPGLRFDGLIGYEGHTLYIQEPIAKRAAIAGAIGRLVKARRAVEAAGLPCRIVSAGGTGSYQITSEIPGVTELQAGGGIFACRYYTELCQVTGHRPAIAVLATVVSRPAPDRAVLDAGLKSLSEFRAPAALADHPDCRIAGLSAEHATVELGPEGERTLRIGDKVCVTPGYSDLTFVLHDRVIGHRDRRVESVWELLGRGMLQ
jgi:D-serine deaminase-like pyridoxal phosphate-dependent protein